MDFKTVAILGALPVLWLWLLMARVVSMLTPCLAPWLSYMMAQRLYYATPFAVYALAQSGGAKAFLTRIGFEASYCMNGASLGPYLIDLNLECVLWRTFCWSFAVHAGTRTLAHVNRAQP